MSWPLIAGCLDPETGAYGMEAQTYAHQRRSKGRLRLAYGALMALWVVNASGHSCHMQQQLPKGCQSSRGIVLSQLVKFSLNSNPDLQKTATLSSHSLSDLLAGAFIHCAHVHIAFSRSKALKHTVGPEDHLYGTTNRDTTQVRSAIGKCDQDSSILLCLSLYNMCTER